MNSSLFSLDGKEDVAADVAAIDPLLVLFMLLLLLKEANYWPSIWLFGEWIEIDRPCPTAAPSDLLLRSLSSNRIYYYAGFLSPSSPPICKIREINSSLSMKPIRLISIVSNAIPASYFIFS